MLRGGKDGRGGGWTGDGRGREGGGRHGRDKRSLEHGDCFQESGTRMSRVGALSGPDGLKPVPAPLSLSTLETPGCPPVVAMQVCGWQVGL